MPSGCSSPPPSGGSRSVSPRLIRGCRSSASRPSRKTFTTWRDYGGSARASPPARSIRRRGLPPTSPLEARQGGQRGKGGGLLTRSAGDQLVFRPALVLVAGLLEKIPPGGDVGAAAQQGAPLTLGHAAPDTELDAVVQGIGQTLRPHGAATADQLGPVLCRTLDEKLVWVRLLARGTTGPVSDPHVVQLLLIVTPSRGRHARTALTHGSGRATVTSSAPGKSLRKSNLRKSGPAR